MQQQQQQQQRYPQLWLGQNHPLRGHPAVENHYDHHQAGQQLQPNNPGPKAHFRPWDYSDKNNNRHLVLLHNEMPGGQAHHNTDHGQIWRISPSGFEGHPNNKQAPPELQKAWKTHQQTLGSVEHVMIADKNFLGHLCPLASIAQSMDTFACNIFVTFFFESEFSVHEMQTLLAQNLPSHLLHRCGTLAYQQTQDIHPVEERRRALKPYLESHGINLLGCLFDRGSFSQSEIQRLINEKILPSSLRYAEIFTTSALARLSNTEARFDGGASPALYPEQILSRANNKYGKVEQASQKLADAFRFGIKPSKPPVVACTTRALEPKALLWLKDQLVNETLLPVGTQMHVKIRGPLPNNLSAFVRRSCWLISTGSFYSNALSTRSLEHFCDIFLAQGLNVLILCPGLDDTKSQQLQSVDRSGGQRIMVQQSMISSIELFKQPGLQGALLLGGWGMANEALANRKPAIYLPTTKEQESTAHVMQHLLGEAGAAVLPSLGKGENNIPSNGEHAAALEAALKIDRAGLANKFNEVLKRQAEKEAKELQNVKYLVEFLNVKLKHK